MKNAHIRWPFMLILILSVVLLVSCGGNASVPTSTRPVAEDKLTAQPNMGETPTAQPNTGDTPTAQPSSDLSDFVTADPAEVDNSGLPVTSVEELHITGHPPDSEVDIQEYRLIVNGLVQNPLTLTYEALLAYPAVTEVVLLVCSGFFVDNAEWTGVAVATLLGEAGIRPEATSITFHALDNYTQILPLEDVQREGVFLAYTVNGQTLPAEHGYPLRLVAKGKYGFNWVKWVERIEVS
jgi:sulfoxide reductase catalytic subunit YedY